MLTGCGVESPDPTTQPSPPIASSLSPKSSSPPSIVTPSAQEPAPVNELQVQVSPDANLPSIQRDYATTTPLPATDQVTIRRDIRMLDHNQLIADCPTDTAPYAFAESTNYFIQICSAEFDPWLPKYYIGQAKDGSGILRITNTDLTTARQLIFRNDGYTYTLHHNGARPDLTNAYLEVYTPDGTGYGEALLYLYERLDRPAS